jgi:hypothetical protein
MPTIAFAEIECLHPGEPGADEMWLRVRTEQRPAWTGRYGGLWGPVEMREGDVVRLRPPGSHTIDPIEFDDFACIQLREHDPFDDDLVDELSFTRPFGGFGPQEVVLPQGLFGPSHQAYRLAYEYLEEPSVHPRHRIELLSLECNDAQGTSDRVSLWVNEVLLWGPETMRTHDVEEFGTLSCTFCRLAEVRLRETRGQEWSRTFTLVPDEYRINTPLEHDFLADSGITGDAHYTLRYRMRLLPAR